MVDIGWAKNDCRAEFELTMQPHDLVELLMRRARSVVLLMVSVFVSCFSFKARYIVVKSALT